MRRVWWWIMGVAEALPAMLLFAILIATSRRFEVTFP